MKKINMVPFLVKVPQQDGSIKEIPYGIKDSLSSLLFQPALKLMAVSLLLQNKLVERVLAAGDELLLEDEEYNRVKAAIDIFEGFGRNDVEFVSRILNADSVEVKEAEVK